MSTRPYTDAPKTVKGPVTQVAKPSAKAGSGVKTSGGTGTSRVGFPGRTSTPTPGTVAARKQAVLQRKEQACQRREARKARLARLASSVSKADRKALTGVVKARKTVGSVDGPFSRRKVVLARRRPARRGWGDWAFSASEGEAAGAPESSKRVSGRSLERRRRFRGRPETRDARLLKQVRVASARGEISSAGRRAPGVSRSFRRGRSTKFH